MSIQIEKLKQLRARYVKCDQIRYAVMITSGFVRDWVLYQVPPFLSAKCFFKLNKLLHNQQQGTWHHIPGNITFLLFESMCQLVSLT